MISPAVAILGDRSCLPRAHSIRGVATSAALLRNWSVSKVLEAATWRSNPVFYFIYVIFILLRKSFTPSGHLLWRALCGAVIRYCIRLCFFLSVRVPTFVSFWSF